MRGGREGVVSCTLRFQRMGGHYGALRSQHKIGAGIAACQHGHISRYDQAWEPRRAAHSSTHAVELGPSDASSSSGGLEKLAKRCHLVERLEIDVAVQRDPERVPVREGFVHEGYRLFVLAKLSGDPGAP